MCRSCNARANRAFVSESEDLARETGHNKRGNIFIPIRIPTNDLMTSSWRQIIFFSSSKEARATV